MTEEILARVRKILAKAEDPAATPQEAETYTAKAAELIAGYGIDRALLARADPTSDVVGDAVVPLDAPYALDKADLLSTVAVRLRCRAVRRERYVDGSKEVSLHLFGYDSDLVRVEVLFTSLLLQATTVLARTRAPRGESVAAYRRSWLSGFSGSVGRRLAASEDRAFRRADAATSGPSVALVLADRSGVVEQALEQAYPDTRTAQRRRLTGSGGRAGWTAGEQADLGGGSVPVYARRASARLSAR